MNVEDYSPILQPETHRPEANTLLTYPEWHIVHAYEEYAEVLRLGDPHNFHFLKSIFGFWFSLCSVSKKAGDHGGFPWKTKVTIYTIGVSFSLELLVKALYEESIGRIFTLIRGSSPAPLDILSARQAKRYAEFLRQTPWYQWDFRKEKEELKAKRTNQLRDRERAVALGLEFGAKAFYAGIISNMVQNIGHDNPRLRILVKDISDNNLKAFPDVRIIQRRGREIEIETPRYRRLTNILLLMSNMGANFIEISGNDDIMISVLSNSQSNALNNLYSFDRQGFLDIRHLELLKVTKLAERIRYIEKSESKLEHIYDY